MIERSKKTWEPLLTTPLTGSEILSSKSRVAARYIWAAARWLIPLWLLGIACGALHPLGALAAAASLAAGIWLGLAMGVRAAIRPGATTRSVNTAAAIWSLTMMVVGGLTVIAPLCSGRDLDRLRAGDARLPGLLAFVVVAAAHRDGRPGPVVTRRCFDRFDEWSGRPHRAAHGRAGQRRACGVPARPGRSGGPRPRLAAGLVGIDFEITIEPADPQHVADRRVGPGEAQPAADLLQLTVQAGQRAQHVAGHRPDAREIQHQPGMARLDEPPELPGQLGDVVLVEEDFRIQDLDDGAPLDRAHPDGGPSVPTRQAGHVRRQALTIPLDGTSVRGHGSFLRAVS